MLVWCEFAQEAFSLHFTGLVGSGLGKLKDLLGFSFAHLIIKKNGSLDRADQDRIRDLQTGTGNRISYQKRTLQERPHPLDGTVAAALISEGVFHPVRVVDTTFIFANYDTLRRDIVAEHKSVASVRDAPWIFTSISPKDMEETRYKEVSRQEGLLERVDH